MTIRFGRSGFCETLEQSHIASNGKLITKDFVDQLNMNSIGYNTQGIIMLLMGTIAWMFIVPPLATFLISFIGGVIYPTKNEQEFYDTYEAKKRPWF